MGRANHAPPAIPVNNEAHSCDNKRIDLYIGEAMAQLVEGEADEAKRVQFRDIKDAFAAFYDDGTGTPWPLMAILDSIELTPAEFNEVQRITDQLGGMRLALRSLLDEATRLADRSACRPDRVIEI